MIKSFVASFLASVAFSPAPTIAVVVGENCRVAVELRLVIFFAQPGSVDLERVVLRREVHEGLDGRVWRNVLRQVK